MNYQTITYQKREHIGYITLNRPEAANAINVQMAMELEGICCQIEQDDDIRVVLLVGSGEETFCSGEDLNQICDPGADGIPQIDGLKVRSYSAMA